MKYNVKFEDIFQKKDLLKFAKACMDAYTKEKNETKNVAPGLFGEYMRPVTNFVQLMIAYSSNLRKELRPYLGFLGKKEKNFSQDSILTAIENGHLEEIVDIIEKAAVNESMVSKYQMISMEMRDYYKSMSEDGFSKDIKENAEKNYLRKKNNRKANYKDKKKKLLSHWMRDMDENERMRKLEHDRIKGMKITQLEGSSTCGRKFRFNHKNKDIDVIQEYNLNRFPKKKVPTLPIDRIFFERTSYDGISHEMQFVDTRLDNLKSNPKALKIYSLDVYHQLTLAHKTRTFWDKFCHPWKNIHENSIISDFKDFMKKIGITTDEIKAAKESYKGFEDYAKEISVAAAEVKEIIPSAEFIEENDISVPMNEKEKEAFLAVAPEVIPA